MRSVQSDPGACVRESEGVRARARERACVCESMRAEHRFVRDDDLTASTYASGWDCPCTNASA
eukprot:1673685-Pleurochrysis_carterae.AAC.1